MWFAFEFNTTYYIGDMEVWNYNGYPGDCLPEGTQSPCQWSTRPHYSVKDWRISYSTDKIVWKEKIAGSAAKGTALTQGPQMGWNWSDDAQYPDMIEIEANAKYVVLTCVNSYQPGIVMGIGEARFEKDPNRATAPYRDGGDKFQNMPLSWTKGADVTIAKHKVYLSTSETDVVNRDAPNTVVTSTSYTWPGLVAGPVGSGTQYYWAVDELNAGDVEVGEGHGRTWSFTEIDLSVLDDFESYDLRGPNYLYNVWVDGFVLSGNHPHGGYSDVNEATYGWQHLKLSYDNDGTWSHTTPYTTPIDSNYSQARVETDNLIASCRDLTANNIAWIRTWVLGAVGNDANEQVYLKLEDGDGNSAMVQYLPATDMDDGAWHEWAIPLSDFTTANPNLNLADVNAVSLVVGDETGPPSGTGNGVIYLDDVRLQPPECGIKGEVDPPLSDGDLNDDCAIDWKDVAILVSNWLDSGTSP
jgi:hypothetical protein